MDQEANRPEILPEFFTAGKIGPLTLRNRSIRSAAFEGMCPGNRPSEDLLEYHRSVAAGGIGMTTIAYAAVDRSGLSFNHQLWLRPEVIKDLRKITDAVHKEGAAASIQIGHCGLMAKRSVAGGFPIAPSGGFNLYGITFPRAMNPQKIREIIDSFGNAVNIAYESGFDAVEVHAGHGYLISQFLSPYTNKRKDEWGGSFENRTRFMKEVMNRVMSVAGNRTAVLVKMNMRDAVRGGMEPEESIRVARILENLGAHALVLSGGMVSASPMHVMRGQIPAKIMASGLKNPFMKIGISLFGGLLIKKEPFSELFFLEDAIRFRQTVKTPLVYVGGVTSKENIEEVMRRGFDFVQFARPLIHDPCFINKIKTGEIEKSGCEYTNYCIAVMYSGRMRCHQHEVNLPNKWKRILESLAV
jgi:2,4-dienoyl-CoA reductase-like NADH-dependent reductase (Old Yellow Enzyme family)